MSPCRRLNCYGEQLKPFFPQGTMMSLGRKSLSCLEEQLKLVFPREKSYLMDKELMLSLGAI
jgi:hypothetical protein